MFKVCWHEAAIEYYSVAMSFETKLIFWRRKCYTIRLDSFLYLSSFTTTIKTTVYSSSLFSTDLDSNGPVRVTFCGGHVYELFVFEHILENSRVYFPLLFTDCLQWSRIPMTLGSVFLDVAVIWPRHDRTNLHNQCVFRFNTEASINGVSCQHAI